MQLNKTLAHAARVATEDIVASLMKVTSRVTFGALCPCKSHTPVLGALAQYDRHSHAASRTSSSSVFSLSFCKRSCAICDDKTLDALSEPPAEVETSSEFGGVAFPSSPWPTAASSRKSRFFENALSSTATFKPHALALNSSPSSAASPYWQQIVRNEDASRTTGFGQVVVIAAIPSHAPLVVTHFATVFCLVFGCITSPSSTAKASCFAVGELPEMSSSNANVDTLFSAACSNAKILGT